MEVFKSIFGAGTAAIITVSFIHPIDVVKTRLQISSGKPGEGGRNYKALGITGTVRVILKEEGVKSFWKGIGPAWLREASYTSLRLGLYGPIKHFFGVKKDSNFLLKFASGSLAGAIGSTAGNPFDVVKTRMMASESKNAPLRQIFSDIYHKAGMGGFYRGLQANIMRAMVLNGTKMACYDEIRQQLMDRRIVKKKGILLEALSAFGAGFFMTCTVAPFDKIRTRLMNQPPDAKIYKGFVDCAVKIITKEGVRGLWVGFIPIWTRFAPTTTGQLVIFSQLKILMNIEGEGGA
jgi:hypothetical protein